MKLSFKRFCAFALAIAMLVSASCMTVFAKQIITGNSNTTVYLGWAYYSDPAMSTVATEMKAGTTYYVSLKFYNNPATIADSIGSFQLFFTPDADKLEVKKIIAGDTGAALTSNILEGTVKLAYISQYGISKEEGFDGRKVLESGTIANFAVTAKVDISSTNGLLSIDEKTAVMTNGHTDEESKYMNVVELPHFAASVDASTKLYTRSTKADVKAALTYTFINADGTLGTVDTSKVEVTLPEGGLQADVTNKVTVEYEGYTCVVDVTAELDVRTAIKVTKVPPKMSYTSGETLNLTGLEVEAEYGSGYKHGLDFGVYGTIPSKTTPLTVKDHDKTTLKVKLGELEADVGTLTVSPADISTAVIGDITGQTYQGEAGCKPEPTVTLNGETLTKDVDYTLSYENNVDAGSNAKIKVTGMGEYTGSTEKTFTIGKATGELTLKVNGSTDPQSIKYRTTPSFADGDGNPLGRNSSDETKIQFKLSTAADTAYTEFHYANHSALDVGEYSFRAVRAESKNVGPATSNVVTVNITWKPITDWDINILIPDQTYTGSELTPDIRATIGEVTLEKDKDYTLSDYKFNLKVTSESQLASVKVTGTGNYDGETTVYFTINPKPLGDISEKFASVDTTDKDYTGNAYTPAVPETVTIDLATTLEKGKDYTVTYGENTNAGTNAGTITIAPVPGSNYTFETINKTFTIKPKQIKITSSDYDWVSYYEGDKIDGYVSDGSGQQTPYFDYDGNEHGIKLQFKDTALANGIKLETLVKCTYTNAVNTNASGYTAYVKFELNEDCKTNYQLLDSDNKEVTERTLAKTWSIHKATLQVTAPDLNILCSELVKDEKKNYDYSLSWLGEGIKPIPTEAKTSNKVSFSHASEAYDPTENAIMFGKVEAKASTTTGASFDLTLKFDNYNDLNVTVKVNYINKKPVNPTMEKIDATYGETYAPVVMLDGEDVTANCTFTYNGSATKPTNAGTYTVVATYSDNVEEDGYPGHTGTATTTLTITQKELKADVKHAAITYGDEAPTADYTVKFTGLVGNEKLELTTDYTVSTTYKKGDDAKDYSITITLKETTAAKNYKLGPVTGTLTVNPKSLTAAMVEDVTAGLTYNGNEQKPTVTVKDGEKTLTSGTDYTLTYKNNTNAGTATVTVEGKGNYTGKVEKNFSIAKATPTIAITGVKQDATYTGERFSNTYVQTNNNPSDLEVTYEYYLQSDTACTTQVKPIDAGSYKVRISFAGNDNYNAVEPTATVDFTIGRANHPISIAAASVTYTGAPYSETNITVTPTCEVTFTYYASETSTDPIAHPTDVGKYWVVASYAGTDNYNSSTSARVSFSITKATPPTPAEVKVDGEDKTLKDLEDSMRKDLGSIEGKFTWRDSDGKELPSDTKIEANKEYEWTFTPTGKDAKNYRPIYGKTTPYVRDDLSWLPGVLGGGSTFNFRDVTRYDYFYSAVKWAAENGIASGTSRYTFSPDAVCTRAQTVTFLWRAAGSPMPTYRISPFTDVNYGDYYYNAVLWAVEQGITTGLTATTFGPDKTVTRGQVATFLYRAASAVKPNITNPFTDVKSTAYNYDAILWAYDNRITTGTSTMTFSPDAFCTRAQIVTFLYRFYQGR